MQEWQTTTRVGTYHFARVVNDEVDVVVCNYGAMLYDLKTKDAQGQWQSIVMQFASLDDYQNNPLYLNAVVGPVAGRIQGASYSLKGQTVRLQANHLQTESLHSGDESLAFQWWEIERVPSGVVCRFEKPSGPSQFPGHQRYEVHYSLDGHSLRVDFYATTTEDTLVNLTHHAYFNLSGNLSRDILNHQLFIRSTHALRLNEKFSPVGVEPVPPFLDFSRFDTLAHHLTTEVDRLPTQGIDHPLLLTPNNEAPSVVLFDPVSTRSMSVYTTYPCVVVYTHNHPGPQPLKHVNGHPRRFGICLETQYEPNGIHVDGLHSAVLRAGESYHHQTRFEFALRRPSIK